MAIATTLPPPMTPEMGLKLFQAHRLVQPSLVFMITRSCDGVQYAYFAKRNQNKLVDGGITCRIVECGDWKTQVEVNGVLLDNFFGASVSPIEKSSKYNCRLNGFPERNMVLHLKKNSDASKSDGHVTSMSSVEVAPGIVVKEVQIYNIYLDMTFDDMSIPDVSRVQIQAIASLPNVAHVPKTLYQALNQDKVYVTETILVTPELKKRFDVVTLARGFFASVVSKGSGGTENAAGVKQ